MDDDDESESPAAQAVVKSNAIGTAVVTEAKDKLIVNSATIQKLQKAIVTAQNTINAANLAVKSEEAIVKTAVDVAKIPVT